ncbi:MAG: competence protein ComEA [Actinomycetota bacterium]|nr:competence protein ComEA [Actinomycetota bacterium]
MPDPLHPLPPPVAPATWRGRLDDVASRLGVEPATLLRRTATAAVALVVGLVALVAWRSSSAPADIALPRARPATAPAAVGSSPNATGTVPATAHAAGAIARPGVYRLPPGARVTDLIDAAGGPAADADLDQLNLAAPVADGERVYVPRRGEAPPPVAAGASGGQPVGPVDLNAATAEQLDALPGVGPATAQAILQYRTQHGRFHSVEDLLDVRGIGDAKLEQLRDLVKV